MKTVAGLTIRFANGNVQRGLASVLAPDNEGAPRGLWLSMRGRGNKMEIQVQSVSPAQVIATLLGLLRDISLFQEVWLLSQGSDAGDHRD